jgi:hypothetical protein
MIKKLLLTDWSFMRILRLSLSVFFAINAIQTHNAFSGFIAAFLLFQAVTNTGCCGASGCAVPKVKKDREKSDEIEFEEIKQKS